MFRERGTREKAPEQLARQLADFEAVLKLMRAGIPMTKACASLKIQRQNFCKALSDDQRRIIKEAKVSMRGTGILKAKKRKLVIQK